MPARGVFHTIYFTVWDTANNVGKTGDAGNLTLRWNKDGTAAAPTNSPAEVDATNQPGTYKLILTAAECLCKLGRLAGKSSTANIVVLPVDLSFDGIAVASWTIQGGSENTIQLSVNESNEDGVFNRMIVRWIKADGSRVSQWRYIRSYSGSTKIAVIDPPWVGTPPANGDWADIFPEAGINVMNIGGVKPNELEQGRMDVKLGKVEDGVTVLASDLLNKTGMRLSPQGVDDVWDEPVAEPVAPFSWAGATMRSIFAWVGAVSKNKITQSGTAQTVRNDEDTAPIGQAPVADDGTTYTRGKFT